MKGRILIIFLAAALMLSPLVAGGCGDEVPPAYSAENPLVLKYSYFAASTSPTATDLIIPMGEELERRTEGRVKLEYYWGTALGTAQEHHSLAAEGIADIVWGSTGYVPGRFLLTEVGSMPLAAEDPVNVTRACLELMDEGYFDEEFNDVKLLFLTVTPSFDFFFKDSQPMTVEELSGFTVYTLGTYQTEIIKELGSTTALLTPTDVYTAIQTGLCNACFVQYGIIQILKLEDQIHYILEVNVAPGTGAYNAMNLDTWNKLTPEDQEILMEVFEEGAIEFTELYSDIRTTLQQEYPAEYGMERYTLPPAEMDKLTQIVMPVWGKFISDCEAAGKPGEEIIEKFVSILEGLGEEPAYKPE
jgi:TRAP-type C4-dicarboxylate transport system substrate-binding protein